MGCCLSSRARNHDADHHSSIDGAPPSSPPAVLEEETVKEVLLETPLAPKNEDLIKALIKPIPTDSGPPVANQTNSDPVGEEKEEIVSEVSGLSEMCSYSESYSNATAREKKEGEEEEDGVVDQRPPPRKRRAGRGRGVARRMAAPSPERRRQVAPLRPGRGRGLPRNTAEDNARRRDAAGEGSGRRSRSPVRREEVDAQRSAGGEKVPAAREPPNDVVPAEEAESLENPVVSLECFIFL